VTLSGVTAVTDRTNRRGEMVEIETPDLHEVRLPSVPPLGTSIRLAVLGDGSRSRWYVASRKSTANAA
jgi:hypothetical protein